MKTIAAMILCALLVLLSTQAQALERFDIVTTLELKQLLDARASGKADFILVNTLDELIFKDSSISGSINIPWCKIEETAGRLGENKNRLIISYCMGYR
jgi:hypothetical protein